MRLDEVVNKNYAKLNENDLYILKYINNNKSMCKNLTINDLAERCSVSRTTILRFTQKLGFKGYSEFKVFLKWEEENGQEEREDYLTNFFVDLDETIKNLDYKIIDEVCKSIYKAKRVFIYGTGTTQNSAAKEMQRIFLGVSKYLYVVEGETEMERVVLDTNRDDVFIIISLSGNREFLNKITNILNINGAKVISLTRLTNNKLARISDYNLYISSTPLNINNEMPYETTSFFFILVDILFRKYLDYIDYLKLT